MSELEDLKTIQKLLTPDIVTALEEEGFTVNKEALKQEIAKREHEHEHHYTIPVEWEYRRGTAPVYESPAGYDSQGEPTKKVVTKLRCTCGAETDR